MRLSFVKYDEDGAPENYWNPPPKTGDYVAECELGSRYATELVREMAESKRPFMLIWVANAIARSGRDTGVEIGFWQEIAARAAP